MLRSRIIPCLLLRDGGLVKTREFKDEKYVGDPLNAVKIFNEKEVDELIFLDIDASSQGRGPNFSLLRSIATESRMPLCYGGGVTSAEQAVQIIGLGYEKVSISSAAIDRPELIREMARAIGSQSVVVTLDVKRNTFFSGYTVFTQNARKKQKIDLLSFCKEAERLGAGEIVINSIDRDGMMGGFDLDLAKMVRDAISLPVTFIGGAGTKEHLQDLIEAVGVVGAGAGSMFVFRGTYRAVLINYERPDRLC